MYSRGVRTWVKTLGADISINKACNPINLGAKRKLLISTFHTCPWIKDLDLNCLRYARKTDCNLNCKKCQNKSVKVLKVH